MLVHPRVRVFPSPPVAASDLLCSADRGPHIAVGEPAELRSWSAAERTSWDFSQIPRYITSWQRRAYSRGSRLLTPRTSCYRPHPRPSFRDPILHLQWRSYELPRTTEDHSRPSFHCVISISSSVNPHDRLIVLRQPPVSPGAISRHQRRLHPWSVHPICCPHRAFPTTHCSRAL